MLILLNDKKARPGKGQNRTPAFDRSDPFGIPAAGSGPAALRHTWRTA